MASAEIVTAAEPEGPLSNPWPWTIAGVGATLTALFIWVLASKDTLIPVRALLVLAGVVAAGAAIAIKPRPEIIFSGGLAAFFGCFGLYTGDGRPAAWDSIRLVLAVAAVVAGLAALITLLPRVGRRIVVSILILLHFGGIATAVSAAPPAPWLANVLWTYFYRPYLEFMYLNNAYHFYAPEPGPAFLLWFRVEYTKEGDDRSTYWHWEKVPDLDADGVPEYTVALQYQRRLALAEQATRTGPTEPGSLGEQVSKRIIANQNRLNNNRPVIPFAPNQPAEQQYLAPSTLAKRLVEPYVRHVAHRFQEEHPEATVTGVKLYRVVHQILSAPQLEEDADPNDPIYYLVHYWGEYDTKGRLKKPDDPFLYWLIPILKVRPDVDPYAGMGRGMPNDPAVNRATEYGKKDPKLLNYVYLHAGDPKWIRYPGKAVYEEYKPGQ
jgi:hypothetical protein